MSQCEGKYDTKQDICLEQESKIKKEEEKKAKQSGLKWEIG